MIEQPARAPTIRPAGTVPLSAVTDIKPCCWHCRHKLGEQFTRPWRLRCPNCRAVNEAAPV